MLDSCYRVSWRRSAWSCPRLIRRSELQKLHVTSSRCAASVNTWFCRSISLSLTLTHTHTHTRTRGLLTHGCGQMTRVESDDKARNAQAMNEDLYKQLLETKGKMAGMMNLVPSRKRRRHQQTDM
jgi:hypothetical protein